MEETGAEFRCLTIPQPGDCSERGIVHQDRPPSASGPRMGLGSRSLNESQQHRSSASALGRIAAQFIRPHIFNGFDSLMPIR